MNKPNYNIEFAHIYAGEEFGKEQIKSIEILKKIVSKLKKENKTFVTSILIDDFHSIAFNLDEREVISRCKEYGIGVDFIGYESKLKVVADRLFQDLKYRGEIYPVKKYSCALLSASWLLCRLGFFKMSSDVIKNLNNKIFESEKTLTILPKKYQMVENKAIEIIRQTKLKDVVRNIEYKFF